MAETGSAGGLLACAVTVLLVAAAYPRYLQRSDFTGDEERSRGAQPAVPD